MSGKVEFQELDTHSGHRIGVVTLNATKSLNALDQAMIDALYQQLQGWEHDEGIVCVFLQGAGERGFCAGGDVRAIRESALKSDQAAVQAFFEQEYRLDYRIHVYSKPVICWGHGFVMGGGVGLMAGADFRVVTDTTVMAMPEITVGLYPDVGASWLLGHMPAKAGLFAALTACQLNAADAMYLGLGNRFIDHAFRHNVLDALQQADWQQDAYQVTYGVVQKYAEQSAGWLPYSKIREHRDLIKNMMEKPSLADIMSALEALETSDEWLNQARQTALNGSPLSVRLAFEQLRRARHCSLKEAFQSELTLSVNSVMQGDFCEGVRALLVDKDKQPDWRFKSLADIAQGATDSFFVSPWQTHPLADL
ncbi:hypothetical protein GZ77_06590 [Endozoicomonas montiporae]|uniref:3-hydroxyisobutyryl-CoA hydrolase n=2 Tax=Endozoicomonas montiporae TaxID=1027273 RepID=A0A081N6P6_9GAMM|nr:enoyl-CoA hydratase/isomerase family protein [Endozoicomonas montiporae]AMO56449.1 enoyl-CoA hydratase/isomerase [Endozoicomonas montiporae CL-33]KEQ14119.1 hypothetical protein GZ77_06590 [Endozoicomonas montiporae]